MWSLNIYSNWWTFRLVKNNLYPAVQSNHCPAKTYTFWGNYFKIRLNWPKLQTRLNNAERNVLFILLGRSWKYWNVITISFIKLWIYWITWIIIALTLILKPCYLTFCLAPGIQSTSNFLQLLSQKKLISW
jgi:hypothetical protein